MTERNEKMQRITPYLRFEREASEAAKFYVSVFPDSEIISTSRIADAPAEDVELVNFRLMGHEFRGLDAGRALKFNPSTSALVNFDPSRDKNARQRIDEIWARLEEGGKVLMPLGKYPFSKRYGWLEDRYGFSWQMIYSDPEEEERPAIVPFFLFTGGVCGRAEEASDFYLSVFKDARRGALVRHPNGNGPEREGTIMFTDFRLEKQWFAAMDSALEHGFAFNEAVSLAINCRNQREIDYYWEKLSADPKAERCGRLKDSYGVSWQILPAGIDKLLAKNPEKTLPAMLKMKKLIIAELEKAGMG